MLSGGMLSGGTLSGGMLSGGMLSGGTLSGGTLSGGTLSGGTLSGGTLSGGTLSNGTATPVSLIATRVRPSSGELSDAVGAVSAHAIAKTATPANAKVNPRELSNLCTVPP
jgi:uncharacterized protein YjbI with pentapeptide repeats